MEVRQVRRPLGDRMSERTLYALAGVCFGLQVAGVYVWMRWWTR